MIKKLTTAQSATLTLQNAGSYRNPRAYRYSAANLNAIENLGPVALVGNQIVATLPASSITLYELRSASAARAWELY